MDTDAKTDGPGMEQVLSARPSLAARAGFLLGSCPESLKNAAWDTFLLFYYTQVLGLSGKLTGLAIAVSLIFDALVDPLVGAWSDRVRRAPLGRRHTFMAIAVVPFACGAYFLLAPPEGVEGVALFGWLCLFGVLTRFAMTLFTIPLYAIGVELSRQPTERTLLISVRSIGTAAGRWLALYIGFTFFFTGAVHKGEAQFNRAAYPGYGLMIGLVGAALMIGAIILTYRRIRELERLETYDHKHGAMDVVLGVVRAFKVTPNVFVAFTAAATIYLIMATISVYKIHLATFFWLITSEQTRSVALASVYGTLGAAFVAPAIIKVMDRRPAMYLGVAGFSLSNLFSVLLPLLGLFPPNGTPAMVGSLVSLQALGGFFFGLLITAGGAITADVADEHELNTGVPQQGLMQGFLFLATKMASGVSNILAGAFLDIIAFPTRAAPGSVPQVKVDQMAMFICCIIGAAGLTIGFLIRRYDISKEKQARITRELAAMKRGRAATVIPEP